MGNGTEDIISQIKIFDCGYCTNNLKVVFKKYPKELRQFPAMALYFHHKRMGDVLFDTGYTSRVKQNGFISKIYHMLNPIQCDVKDELFYKLSSKGIEPEQINHVILSHVHPDHIGGLKDFPTSKIWCSAESKALLSKNSIWDLVFKNLVPSDIDQRVEIPQNRTLLSLCSQYFDEVYDLFSDGSIILVKLDGHVLGQLGLFFPEHNLFFISDAAWGMDLLGREMKLISRFIQKDYRLYRQTQQKIKKFCEENPDIKLIATHDMPSKRGKQSER